MPLGPSSARGMSFGSSSLLRGDGSSRDALAYHRPPRGGARKEPRQWRTVECKVKRRREPRLDAVIERNKKFRIVQRIQELLGKQEGGRMSLKELGKYREKIGLSGGRRCVALVQKFPSIFQVDDRGGGNIWFTLTPEAARRDARQRELQAMMEPILVDKLCKLLMMSATQTLSLESIGHVRRELGLPEDFKTSFLPRFSGRFRVAHPPAAPGATGGPMLVLQQWDDRLALSVAEANEAAAEANEVAAEVGEAEEAAARVTHSKAVVDGEAASGGGAAAAAAVSGAAAASGAATRGGSIGAAAAAAAGRGWVGSGAAGAGGSAAGDGSAGAGAGSAAGGWGGGGAGGAAAAAGGRAQGGMVRREGVGGVLGDGDAEGEGETGEERKGEEEKEEEEEWEEEEEEEKEKEKQEEEEEEEEEVEVEEAKEENKRTKEKEEEEEEEKSEEDSDQFGVGGRKADERGHKGHEGPGDGWEEGWGEGGGEGGGDGGHKDSKHKTQKSEEKREKEIRREGRRGEMIWEEDRWEEEEEEEEEGQEEGGAAFRKPHLGPVLSCDNTSLPPDSPSQTTQTAQVTPPRPSLTPEELAEAAIGLGRQKAEANRMAYITGTRAGQEEGSGSSGGTGSIGSGVSTSSSSRSSSSSREERQKQAIRMRLKLNLPPGLKLKQSDLLRLQRFHASPPISPYANPLDIGISPESKEAERRAVAVIREFLSLTVEKRCLIDQLTHFRKDFLLPARIYALLLRHPEIFYVSVKGVRDSVFLREAYEGDVLIMSDELADAIEEMRVLMEDGRRRMRRGGGGRESGEKVEYGREGSGEESDWESEDEEEWEEEDEEEEDGEEEEREREEVRGRRVVPSAWKRANGRMVEGEGRGGTRQTAVGEEGRRKGIGRRMGEGVGRGMGKGQSGEARVGWVGVDRWGRERESGGVEGVGWIPVGSMVENERESDKRKGREEEKKREEREEGVQEEEEEEEEAEERGFAADAVRKGGGEEKGEREREGMAGSKERRGKEVWRSKGIHRQGLIKDRW
ncbi:hypothetical protein CLOM_g22062 [Closterium sp. NIES-68]|nr:hypothetical protein CLOM_g22062 [Closterium sp. NIES-68]GJP77748.1 hypothetical protein CLOP_g8103 [Closterium sp. NIES-67]